MKQTAFLFLISLITIFLSGCANWSCRYFANQPLVEPEPYPFTFYINSVKMLPDINQTFEDIDDEDRKLMEILKINLSKKYPQHFTLQEKNAFPIDITVTPGMFSAENNGIIFLNSLLSGFTYGLFPSTCSYYGDWQIVIKSKKFESRSQVYIKIKYSFTVFLGVIFQTHRLVPYMKDYHVCSNGNTVPPEWAFMDKNRFLNPDSDAFLAFFPNALNNLNRDEVEEYFYSHYGEKLKFLE